MGGVNSESRRDKLRGILPPLHDCAAEASDYGFVRRPKFQDAVHADRQGSRKAARPALVYRRIGPRKRRGLGVWRASPRGNNGGRGIKRGTPDFVCTVL